jgi:hypothetical protein
VKTFSTNGREEVGVEKRTVISPSFLKPTSDHKKDKSPERSERKQKIKSPKWLKALEAQSWQAELLISGLVVAGLVQPPKYLMSWLEVYLFESIEVGFMFLDFAFMLVLLGLNCLVLFFGFHFFMGMFGADQTSGNPIFRDFSANRYYVFNNRPHVLQSFNYDNLRNERQLIFTPIIPSDQISGDRLKLFIPIVPREKEAMGLVDLSALEIKFRLNLNRSIQNG